MAERGHKVTDQPADDVLAAAVEHRNKQIENWGQWVAADDISPFGVLAFRKGDPVPVEHVEKFGWAKSDPPMVISRKDAEAQEGFATGAAPMLATEEALMDGLTDPKQNPTVPPQESPKETPAKAAPKSNKAS